VPTPAAAVLAEPSPDQRFRGLQLELGLAQMLLAGQQLIETLKALPAHADPKRLERHGWKTYSQNDEDGILAEIFRRIGAPHRTFVEFGCGDGLENNTTCLLAQGWRGLWIDGGTENAANIRRAYALLLEQGMLKFSNDFITRDNINALIAAAGLGEEVDLLSIDLDGNDYYVWEAISAVDARVVAIEYNAKFHPPHDWCMQYDPGHIWQGDDLMGASLSALTRLGEARGYQLVGCNLTGSNAFFVRRDLTADLFAAPATAQHLFQPARYSLTGCYRSGHFGSSAAVQQGAFAAAGLPWPQGVHVPSLSQAEYFQL
jgi:hypothetical protein